MVLFSGIIYSIKADELNQILQNFYMHQVVDTLPLLETIENCQCPRIYLPVCGSNNQSYTNVCKMNCLNTKLQLVGPKKIKVFYTGVCTSYFEPFDYWLKLNFNKKQFSMFYFYVNWYFVQNELFLTWKIACHFICILGILKKKRLISFRRENKECILGIWNWHNQS